MISRIFSLLLLLTICSPAMGFSVRTEHWNEDVVLHDGRTIKVERNVEWTFRIASGDAGSGFALFKNWPDRYWLKFTHPITQKAIEWQGEQFFDPVLLGLVDDVPYLVILGQPDKKTEKIYGCPELPYIFLKYEKGVWGKWVPIPVEQAPDSLRDANLSPRFNHRIKSGAKLSRNDVLWNIQEVEGSSGGFFQSKIPRGYDKWFYGGKNSHKNDWKRDGCRPSRPPPPKVALPPPQEVFADILETKNYEPELLVSHDESAKLWFNKEQNDYCNKLFRPADPEDRWKGERFAKDTTAQKEVPYIGYSYGDLHALRICDGKSIWFVTHQEILNNVVMTKYSETGDLLTRIKFPNPNTTGSLGIVRTSLKSDGSYLYFDWIDAQSDAQGVHLKRNVKLRILEPKANAASQKIVGAAVANGKPNIPALPAATRNTAVKSFRDCEVCPEMVEIPGTDYALGKYEVTQAEWTALMGENVHDDKSGPTVGADKPVLSKNWESAQAYIARLNKISGKTYRLPTEAEWEYSCYAGSQTKYCGGDDMDAVAWFNKDGRFAPHTVGQKQPNGYGLYDMSGNVWEWMNDCWKGNCALRILRGGSFSRHPLTVREAYIYGRTDGYPDAGFRVLRKSSEQAY